MNILQLCYKLPFPMNDGGAYAIYQSSQAILSQDLRLQIIAMDLLKSRATKIEIPIEFIVRTQFESVVVDNHVRPAQAFMNLFGKNSYFVERFYSETYSNRLKEILQGSSFDIIQLEHLYLGLYLDIIRKYSKAKVVLRTQNVENELWHNYLGKLKNPFTKLFLSIAVKRLEVFEKKIVANVDGIMALSVDDANYFKENCACAKVAVIPVGLDVKKFTDIDIEKQYKNFPVFFHLGSMDWKPNMLGVRWFVNEVLPLLKKGHSEIKVVIAGKNMPVWFFKKADKNLAVHGTVDDSVSFIEDKAILIVPMLAGSGIRIKILESMAMGKTIISTSVGAKGICYEDEKNILIADTPQDFARQVDRCVASEEFCRNIGRNAKELIAEKYELNKVGAQMFAFYREL